MTKANNLEQLITSIQKTNEFFLTKVQKQVNTSLTLRDWLIGFYIYEYDQSGKDRAEYGKGLYKAIVSKLIKIGLKSIRECHLYLCKDLYKLTLKFCGQRPQNHILLTFTTQKFCGQ